MNKTIAILSETGKTGKEISGLLAKSAYNIILHSNGINKLDFLVSDLHKKYNIQIRGTNNYNIALMNAEIIILPVSLREIGSFQYRISELVKDKIVVNLHTSEEETSFPFGEAQLLQEMFPRSKMVAAYRMNGSGQTFIAGDDKNAVKQVCDIVYSTGFEPVVAESLSSVKTF